MNLIKLITVAAVATTLVCGTAHAEDRAMFKVDTQGLNLRDPAAVKLVEGRINRAAKVVCASETTPVETARCLTKARTGALRELGEQVAAAQNAKTPTLVLATPGQR